MSKVFFEKKASLQVSSCIFQDISVVQTGEEKEILFDIQKGTDSFFGMTLLLFAPGKPEFKVLSHIKSQS
jgi:hypothetical protein